MDKYNNIYMTYGELREEALNYASGLQFLGVKKGDKIGLFAESKDEAFAKPISHLGRD